MGEPGSSQWYAGPVLQLIGEGPGQGNWALDPRSLSRTEILCGLLMSPVLTESLLSFPSADMKSPLPETGRPNPQEEKGVESNHPPATKEQARSEIEKDSGYSDCSSESISSEDTPPPPPTTASEPATTMDTPPPQTAYTSIYILQNVILKQPRFLLLQPPLRCHRQRASPSSYLPILRSYPRIAPRLAPPCPTPEPPKDTTSTPSVSKVCKQRAPQLLEVSLRSLALLHRTRETQRSIRELRAHARLYERALQGEDGGWERLRKAMERSGGYRKIPPAAAVDRKEEEGGAMSADETSISPRDGSTTSADQCESPPEEAVTSPVTSSEAAPSDRDTGGAA